MNQFVLTLLTISLCCQCNTRPHTQTSPPLSGVSGYQSPKRLLVFFDGTRNQWDSKTNVRRLYEQISFREDPQVVCLYVDGVGTASSGWSQYLGAVAGKGMKNRMLEGYEFLSRHFNEGDDIYLFGFSRGATQARALAGWISHGGLLSQQQATRPNVLKVYHHTLNEKDVSRANLPTWRTAISNRQHPFSADILASEKLSTRWAEIKFLGVFDTVPATFFTAQDEFQEAPSASDDATRYKFLPYPVIRHIAHAMSLDDRRKAFTPVRVAPPLIPSRTTVNEVWFAGAHSDVGGGYSDSTSLPGVPLNWMMDEMRKVDRYWSGLPRVFEDPRGPQHWSVDDMPYPLLTDIHRSPTSAAGVKPEIHPSVEVRKAASKVAVRKRGKWVCEQYRTQMREVPASSGSAIP